MADGNYQGIAPIDLFIGVTVPRHTLRDCHIWGSSVYVLDYVLAAGKKFPRCQPRSRRGMFLGFITVHLSDVPLVLNIRTRYISPQYHVVFDNDFSTVESIPEGSDPPTWLNVVDLEENTVYIPLDDDATLFLDNDLLSPEELEEISCRNIQQTHLRQVFIPATTQLPNSTPSLALPPSRTPLLHTTITSSDTVVTLEETPDIPTATLKQVIPELPY